MGAFNHILVAVDFSDPAAKALEVALGIAERFGSKLTLMHVYPNPVASYGYAEGIYWPLEEIQRAAQADLDGLIKKVQATYPKVEGLLKSGDPGYEIVEAVKNAGVDLVVMGTHGRRGLTRVLVGSVAEKVVRLSPAPVLTVRADERREAGTGARTGGSS